MGIANRTFLSRILLVLALTGLAVAVWRTAEYLLLGLAAAMGGVLLDTVTEWLSTHSRLSRRSAFFVLVFSGIAAAGLCAWALVPHIILQIDQLGSALPAGIQNLQNWLNTSAAGQVIASHGDAILARAAPLISRFGVDLGDGLIALGVVIILAIYLAAAPDLYKRGLLALVPAANRPKANALLRRLTTTIAWWIAGQLIPMTVLGIVTMIGLLILNIPLVFTLSIFTGLMIFVPFAGAILAFIVTVLITLSSDPSKVVFIGVLFAVVHVLEGYVLTPLVQRRVVRLPPALTIFSQVIMTSLFGLTGLVLATPLAAGCVVLVQELYLHKQGDGGKQP